MTTLELKFNTRQKFHRLFLCFAEQKRFTITRVIHQNWAFWFTCKSEEEAQKLMEELSEFLVAEQMSEVNDFYFQ